MNEKRIQQSFEQMQKAMDHAEKLMDAAIEQPRVNKNHIRINFANRRLSTFWKFIGCAFQILFTGRTTLTVKKR